MYNYKEYRMFRKSENYSTSSSDSSILASWIFRSSSVFNNSVFLTSSSGFSFCMVAASNCKTVNVFTSFSIHWDRNFALGMSKMIFWRNIIYLTCNYFLNSCILQMKCYILILYAWQVVFPTCPVSPALVVVKLTSGTMEKASGGISGLGFLVVRKRRNSSL